ncbi:serine protease [Pseudomonas tritici]|uniref:S1 family peptidase n=1 Tax=Pseudomonas tritici TaxID=2745518 RepID=UPI00387B4001
MTENEQYRRRLIAGAVSTGLESPATEMNASRRDASLDRLAALIKVSELDGDAEGQQLLIDASRGLDAIAPGSDAPLTSAMRVGIEAIIHADGSRPAVLACNDSIDAQDPTLGSWRYRLLQEPLQLRKVLQGVARICLTSGQSIPTFTPVGTGFLTEYGLITNRHVLQSIAVQDNQVRGKWRFHEGVSIDFGAEHDRTAPAAPRARPISVLGCGPNEIGLIANPAFLDWALIEVQVEPQSAALPKFLELELDSASLHTCKNVFAVGFPAKPRPGVEAGQILQRLFGGVFDVKRVSPGQVGQVHGQVVGDSQPPRCFSHDASTLGGSSGSCIVDLEGSWKVIGLHFGGSSGVRNLAHQLACIP